MGAQLCALFPLDESVDVHHVARRVRQKGQTPSELRPRGRPPQREPGRLANHRAPPPASCSAAASWRHLLPDHGHGATLLRRSG